MKKILLPILVIILFYTCSPSSDNAQPDNTNFTIPTVSITTISDITETTANSGGNVTNDGGTNVTSRGVSCSTSPNPTINDNKTSNGTGVGSFTSEITDLISNTTYYVRAYATNSEGTAYSNENSFTTLIADNSSYSTNKKIDFQFIHNDDDSMIYFFTYDALSTGGIGNFEITAYDYLNSQVSAEVTIEIGTFID